ncbi:MAG: hypothetical protein AAF525_08335 [Pseudomonadota bacterium]
MKRVLLTLILCTSSVGTLADDPYDALLDLSGARIQLGELPPGALDQIRALGLFPDVVASEIHQASQQTRANVIEDIKRALRSGLAPDEIDELLTWYRSDLAKKVTQAEIRGQLQGMPDDETQSQLLKDTSRRQQVEKMIRVMNSVALSESFAYSFTVSLLAAASALNDQEFNKREFDDQWPWIIASQTGQIEHVLLVLTLQSLAPLDDVEVDAYFKFLETPTSMKFHSIIVEEFEASFSRQIWDFLVEVQTIVTTHGLTEPLTERANAASPPPQGNTSP